MHVLCARNPEESVCGGEVAGFDGGGLMSGFFELGGNLNRRQSRDLLRLRVLLRDNYGVCEVLITIFALHWSAFEPFAQSFKAYYSVVGLVPLLFL